MKKYSTLIVPLLTVAGVLVGFILLMSLNTTTMDDTTKMLSDQHDIINTVQQIFIQTDERNWDRVAACFADPLQLDYTSMNGGEPARMSPQQVIESWQGVLPGFEATQHSISNFQVNVTGDKAMVKCYGTAVHYLPTEDGPDTWTVVGTYDFHLVKSNDQWKADHMKFNFKFMEGNQNLPTLAQQQVAARN